MAEKSKIDFKNLTTPADVWQHRFVAAGDVDGAYMKFYPPHRNYLGQQTPPSLYLVWDDLDCGHAEELYDVDIDNIIQTLIEFKEYKRYYGGGRFE
jgi:hypothetical protein